MEPAYDDVPKDDPKHDADARKGLLMTLIAAGVRELAYPDQDNVDLIKATAKQL